MILTILVILLLFWLLGAFIVPIGGNLVHLLLVIVLIIVLYRWLNNQSIR